mgnify:CR=1 FL=1
MKSIWFVVFCLLCFFNCENSQSKSSNPLSLVPDDTEIIIRINSAEGLESGMNNNNLIKDYTAGTTTYAPKTPTDTYQKSIFGGNSFSMPIELRFRNEGWKHFKLHNKKTNYSIIQKY